VTILNAFLSSPAPIFTRRPLLDGQSAVYSAPMRHNRRIGRNECGVSRSPRRQALAASTIGGSDGRGFLRVDTMLLPAVARPASAAASAVAMPTERPASSADAVETERARRAMPHGVATRHSITRAAL